MKEFDGCVNIILFEIFLLLALLGLHDMVADECNKDKAVIVIESIKMRDGKYKYTTTQFDFVSDSIYQVGDTIKITRY